MDPTWNQAPNVLRVLKDTPLWLLLACAVILTFILAIPFVRAEVPHGLWVWISIAAIAFWVFSVFRTVAMLAGWILGSRAKRRFHLTANELQSFWHRAVQPNGSVHTQVSVRFAVKNLTDQQLELVRVELAKPRIRGETIHNDVMVPIYWRRGPPKLWGTAEVSGAHVAAGALSEASATIIVKGVPRLTPPRVMHATLRIVDSTGSSQKMRMRLRNA